jgi:hypothetical protein
VATLALGAGCGGTNPPAPGTAPCTQDSDCPNGYYCAVDKTCWPTGQGPGGVDLGTPPDQSPPADLTPPGDMRPALTPPSVIFTSSGGGSASAGQRQLNLCIGGTDVAGTVQAGGLSFTPGAFNTDTQ